MNQTAHQSELLLLAFRYVSGELAADEAALFEVRLADDQVARDALADAVELCAAMTIGCCDLATQSPQTNRPTRRRIAAVLAASLAGVAVIAIVGQQLVKHGGRDFAGGSRSSFAPHTASSILSLWGELRGQDAAVDGEDDDNGADVARAMEVPEWMLTALVTTQGDEPPSPADRDDLDEELNLNL